MKPRERLINALLGREVDRLPWSPNLAYWWEKHTELHEAGEVAFLESIHADPLIRGHYPSSATESGDSLILFKERYKTCEKRDGCSEDGKTSYTEYITPIGTLRAESVYVESGNTWFQSRHPVQTEEDFKILQYLKQDIEITPDFDRYHAVCEKYGDRCLLVPLLVNDLKTAFQSLIEYWVGTEELIYALADYPEVVAETVEVMKDYNRKCVEVTVQCGAPAYITWEDSSTTNVSPALYEAYIAPEIDEWCDIVHKAGGIYLQHACGTLKHLMPIMKETKIDGIESISPPPTGDIEIWDAAKILGERVTLVGGIEPIHFANLRGKEFEDYVANLIEKMKGRPFVLANSDSCPPEVPMENYLMVSEIVDRYYK